MVRNFFNSVRGVIIFTFVFSFLGSLRFESIKENFGAWAGLFFSIEALVFMGFAPALLLIFRFKEPLTSFGFQLPTNKKEAAVLIFLTLVVLMPVIIFFSGQEVFQDYYAFKKGTPVGVLVLIVLPSLIYYFAEEFLFRGFLFWGLWHKIKYHSFWLTSLIFSLLHASKPVPEIFFAFFASLIFCYLSFRTKSFAPAAIVHFLIAITLNLLIVFIVGGANSSGGDFFNF